MLNRRILFLCFPTSMRILCDCLSSGIHNVTSYRYFCGLSSTYGKSIKFYSSVSETSKSPNKSHQKVSPKITLVGIDENVTVVSLDEAKKLANRRDLKLVMVEANEGKPIRPVYKLMTESQYLLEEPKVKNRAIKKGTVKEKLLSISNRIAENDLNARAKNISNWLAKKYEVRIVISGDSGSAATSEKVYDIIAAHVKDEGRIVQKRTKGTDIRFQILPPKTEETDV